MAKKSKSIKRSDESRFAEALGVSVILFTGVGSLFALLAGWMQICTYLTTDFHLSFIGSTVLFMSPILGLIFAFTVWVTYETLED